MPKYLVNWDYGSSEGGPWEAGDVTEEMSEERAAAINRSSPGVLTVIERVDALTELRGIGREEQQALRGAGVRTFVELAVALEAEPGKIADICHVEAEALDEWRADMVAQLGALTRTLEEPKQDRMVRKAKTRDAENTQENFGAITKARYKAMKG